ncbi:MAG: mechanosensitive ion channel, partial [Sediminibacterium sp.]|nr:mechanosensitive ion channel [Sediminibacterium sp.]
LSIVNAQKGNPYKLLVNDTSNKQEQVADTLKEEDAEGEINSLLSQTEDIAIRINRYKKKVQRGFNRDSSYVNLDKIIFVQKGIDSNLLSGATISDVNLRNVSSFKVILIQLNKLLSNWNQDISKFIGSLKSDIDEIDSRIQKANELIVNKDSSLRLEFKGEIDKLSKQAKLLNIQQDSIAGSMVSTEAKITSAYVKNVELLEEVQYRIDYYSRAVFGKTHPNLLLSSPKNFSTPLSVDLMFSIKKSLVLLIFYLYINIWLLVFCVILGLLFFVWVYFNLKVLEKNNLTSILLPLRYTKKKTGLISVLFAFLIPPYLFQSPPAILVELFLFISAVFTTFLIWPFVTLTMKRLWVALFFMSFIFGLDNLLYSYSNGERWGLLIANVITLTIAIFGYKAKETTGSKYNNLFRFSLVILIIGNLFSMLCNVFGYFALSKLFSNSSILQFILAVCLSVITDIFSEAIFLQLERVKAVRSGEIVAYKNISAKYKSILNIIAIVLWSIGFIWSLSFHELMFASISDLLDYSIKIGDLSFTLKSVGIFILTIWVAVILANMVSIIFGTTNQQFATTQKTNVGSWMMLVRLGIISIGFFLAIGAAGIPLEKFAIVFGALSVGIGFGLQNIVGNLVSGIILAFEKPMRVGDVVEIGNQSGTVIEIGIRSSKIAIFDGSEIIVPNSDFITQKLTNWTHSNNFRRVELLISVAYGSVVEKVTEVILSSLKEQKSVMEEPVPSVLMHEFADSAINFRVLFWTSDYDSWLSLKSETLKSIYSGFDTAGIQIPFPQQDIYIKSIPETPIVKV